MEQKDKNYLEFERQLRGAIKIAERLTKASFSKIKSMIDEQGGVYAAHSLLADKELFTYGFKKLAEADLLKLSVENHVVLFADSDLFTPEHVETAKWRLANVNKATDD